MSSTPPSSAAPASPRTGEVTFDLSHESASPRAGKVSATKATISAESASAHSGKASTPRSSRVAHYRRPSVSLACVYCTRCAQYLLNSNAVPYNKIAIYKCRRYQLGQKHCLPIPSTCVPRINSLLKDVAKASPNDTTAQEALRARLTSLVADIQQTNRVSKHASGISTPVSRASKASVLLLQEIQALHATCSRFFDRFLRLYCKAHQLDPIKNSSDSEGAIEGVVGY
ncbi:uncharacterized protein PV09_09654 [Verruconis gallopava]|uniref:Uncharacterized protein n=1 Tax=Verruconis gallopava TaxID=253628 RepID=A0A0D1ZVT0_9PEZI|nr:uncharacterized protein PV09_09654 [Verruconis gallopava]KIV98547.1 hypothetical protein PV09_09654 [Verruconis gallopava]